MFPKIIFVIAMLCIVNATVLTDNVSDDDPVLNVASIPKSCDSQACELLCRRLKFPGGACVNGHCKCDHFLSAEDDDSENKLSELENSVLQQDNLETEGEAILNRCNVKACDWVCRRFHKTSGSCVDGRCKCENSHNAEEKPTDIVNLVSLTEDDPEIGVASIPKSCDPQACERLCRRLKFPGGACVNGHCKCDHFLSAEDEDSENTLSDLENSVFQQDYLETEGEASLNRCNVKVCDWLCRRFHMTSGSCVDGRCKCVKSKVEDAVVEPNVEDPVLIRACNNKKCNQLCRKQKFRGGSCLGANCYCNKFLSVQDENAVDEYSKLDTRRVCKLPKCNRTCTRRGYEGATCVKGRCKCYNISKTSFPVSELSEDPTEHGCNMQACDQLCRRLKFPGGACVNGRCKCDHFFADGDASPFNDITSDEKEESNDILTNEDKLTAPASSASNTTCNQMCRRQKYAGGWCRFGQCHCY